MLKIIGITTSLIFVSCSNDNMKMKGDINQVKESFEKIDKEIVANIKNLNDMRKIYTMKEKCDITLPILEYIGQDKTTQQELREKKKAIEKELIDEKKDYSLKELAKIKEEFDEETKDIQAVEKKYKEREKEVKAIQKEYCNKYQEEDKNDKSKLNLYGKSWRCGALYNFYDMCKYVFTP